jgi:hypothetical protein
VPNLPVANRRRLALLDAPLAVGVAGGDEERREKAEEDAHGDGGVEQ